MGPENCFSALDEARPLVSVIVPAFNEASNIGRCIESILVNHYPRELIEIIVVDNGSTDGTPERAAAYPVKVLQRPNVTISRLRNEGVRESKGKVVAFIDADCAADQDWIERGVQSLRLDCCITGSRIDIPAESNWLERAWFKIRSSGRVEALHINTANLFVSRPVFDALGGFDEALKTGEDTEFSARAKRHVKVIDDASIRAVHYGNPKTLRAFIKREIWHGLGAFGSFRVDWFDKPLLGTIVFLLLSIVQGLGLVYASLGRGLAVFGGASALLAALLAASVFHRRKVMEGPLHAVQLFVLHYFFFFARSISLVYLLLGRSYYHSIKVSEQQKPQGQGDLN